MNELLKALRLFFLLPSLRQLAAGSLLLSSQHTLALSVAEMVDLAVGNNQKYQQTQTQVRFSEFARDSSDAPSRPQVSLGANHQYIDSSAQNDIYDVSQASITLRQSLWNEQLNAPSQRADLQIKRAKIQQKQQLQLSLKELSNLYFDYTSAKEQLDLMSLETNALESLLEAENARFQANATSTVKLSQVRADYYQARAEEVSQQSKLESAIDVLVSALGVRTTLPEPKKSDQLDLVMPDGDESSWLATALSHNYNLLNSQVSIQLVEQQIDAVEDSHSPQLSVFGSYTWKRNNLTNAETSNNEKAIGVELSWLLYGGGSVSSQTNQFQESYRSAQLELDFQQKTVANLVRHDWRTLLATQSVIEANALSVQSAYQAYQASQISFDASVLSYTDFLTRQNNYFNAAFRLRATRYNYMRSYISLYYNAGLLDRDNFIDIVSVWIET